jgi:hypothetical protein
MGVEIPLSYLILKYNTMKLAEVKYINVGEMRFPIKLTNRAMIEYENLTGESIVSFKGSERLSKLFFCTAKAGAKAEGIPFTYNYETFLDAIDDFYLDVLQNFTKALFGDMQESVEPVEEKKA